MLILYKLTFINGKIYIGQTTRTLKIRMLQHKRSVNSGSKLPVHQAWKTLGEPIIEVIGEYETEYQLDIAEIKAIREYNSIAPNGYNLAHGGNTAPSKSKSVAMKIAEKATGRKQSEETKRKTGQITSMLWDDPEYRAKVSDGLKRCWTDDKRKERSIQSKSIWEKRKASGWKMSESHKEKLRNKIVSKDSRKRMSDSAKKVKRKITTSSGYAGVNFDKKRNVYAIFISIDCKTKYLGFHEDPIEAAKIRDKYIIENNLHHALAFPYLMDNV